MMDEWEFSSNLFSCSPTNNYSSFYPNAASLVEQHPKVNFHVDSAFIASALFPAPSLKRQSLDSISAHDHTILNIYDSVLSSSPPLELLSSESTLRCFNPQQCVSYPRVSSQECIHSETLDSSQSQSSYSSISDNMKSDSPLTGNYGSLILPASQLLSSDIESQHQRFPNTPGGECVVDELRKTNLVEFLFHGPSQHPGHCSDTHTSVLGTSMAPTSPIPLVVQNSDRHRYNRFIDSQTTSGYLPPSTEDKPVPIGKEVNKNNESSGNDTAKIKRFPCPECGQKFARAFNLQTHIATHAGTRPFSCPADGCSKAFSRRHDLGRHMTAVHHQWLAAQNLSVAETVPWKKDKYSTYGRRNRTKQSHQSQKSLE